MVHFPTKSIIKGKTPVLVPVVRIRPTNTVKGDALKVEYSPILLVSADDNYYYIVDGNHRFFRKIFFSDSTSRIPAWVLKEGDQESLHGDPLPQVLREWKERLINLEQLCTMAKNAYKGVANEVNSILESVSRTSKHGAHVEDIDHITYSDKYKGRDIVDNRNLALALSGSILNLIKGTTTIQEESLANNISEEEMASLHKCFIDGGIKALMERLKGPL